MFFQNFRETRKRWTLTADSLQWLGQSDYSSRILLWCFLSTFVCSMWLSCALGSSHRLSWDVRDCRRLSILADFRHLPSALVSSRRIITGSNVSWEVPGLGGSKKQLILVRLHWHNFDIISVFASELNREWTLLLFILLQSCRRDGKASGRYGTVAYK